MSVPYYLSFSLLRSNSIDIAADFDYNDNCIPYNILLDPGRYFFEAWGAAGGNYGGNGGYTAGTIDFSTRTQLYAIVGGMGEMPVKEVRNTKGGCGGGGKGGAPASTDYYSGAGGGGATTVYYQNYSTDNRILVSGGGGGFQGPGKGFTYGHACGGTAGYAGGLTAGYGHAYNFSYGGTQTIGNPNGIGSDGRNGVNGSCQAEGNGGSGGGYRGGLTSPARFDNPGGGGSSYISGNTSCVQYENIIFKNTIILSGEDIITLPSGMTSPGNPDNGYLRITYIYPSISCMSENSKLHFFESMFLLLIE